MLDLARFPDWPERLDAVVSEHSTADFAWGRYDCATLWIDVVAALTGVDPSSEFQRWRTQHGALRALKARGFDSVSAYVDGILPRVAAAKASRGDLAFPADAWLGPLTSPAVVMGAEAVSRSPQGWVAIPRARLVTFYRV